MAKAHIAFGKVIKKVFNKLMNKHNTNLDKTKVCIAYKLSR